MSEYMATLAASERMVGSLLDFAAASQAVDCDLAALLDRLNCGAIVVQRDGVVAVMNPYAEELVGDGLLVQHQRLGAASHHHQCALDDLLRNTFDSDTDDCAYMCLPRPSGKRPLLLQAVPLTRQPSLAHLDASPVLVVLLIFDLEGRQRAPCSSALRALGLTPAEAMVASLVGTGLSPLDASDRLGITVLTVRTHLKAIFQKLGLQRQGDLVHVVSRLSAMS